jgi:hypothetical protein
LKNFKGKNGMITFEAFCNAMNWIDDSDVDSKIRGRVKYRVKQAWWQEKGVRSGEEMKGIDGHKLWPCRLKFVGML